MAKYGRFDPRNKKNSRHKQQSIYKDIKIRHVEETPRRMDWNKNNLSWSTVDNGTEFEDDYND